MVKTTLCLLALATVAACTPAQKADARTALNVSKCVNEVVLRHVDADLKDPVAVAVLAADIATECDPRTGAE